MRFTARPSSRSQDTPGREWGTGVGAKGGGPSRYLQPTAPPGREEGALGGGWEGRPQPTGGPGPTPMGTPCVGQASPPGCTPARGPGLEE